MSTDHPSIDGEDTGYHPWLATVLAGLAAGGAMGVLLSLGTGLMPSTGFRPFSAGGSPTSPTASCSRSSSPSSPPDRSSGANR
jgi:hypothetical protein